MTDDPCIHFLQDVLPHLQLRWPGFRKPRRQVCRRIERRMAALGLGSFDAYRAHLDDHPDEWRVLDFLCRVTISRFRRDRGMWRLLEDEVLPRLAASVAEGSGARFLRAWSAGCASGEEPYTLSILWRLVWASRFPSVRLSVLATDFDPHMLARARRVVYPPGTLRELPGAWRLAAFDKTAGDEGDLYRLRPAFRKPVRLAGLDARSALPHGPFHLVFCRNLAFTYFDADLQREIAGRLVRRLAQGGCLAVGAHESLPDADSFGMTNLGNGLYALEARR